MTPSSAKVLRRAVGVVAAAAIFFFALRATWYVARLPESNCTTHAVLEVRSPDQRYRATLHEKDCNSGETLFHSVNIDLPRGVIRDFPLESDQMRPARPQLQWADAHTLDVTVPTNTLSGALTEHWVEGLTVSRTFAPGAREQ